MIIIFYPFLLFPPVPAVLTGADRPVGDVPDGAADRGGGSPILLFLKRGREQAKDQPGNKQEDPAAQIHNPPPPADQQPPEAAVAFLLIFRHRSGSGSRTMVLLECVHPDITASAFRTIHFFRLPYRSIDF